MLKKLRQSTPGGVSKRVYRLARRLFAGLRRKGWGEKRGASLGASSDDVLKLSLAAAALAGGLSVAYHYAVYIPAHDQQIESSTRSREQQQQAKLAASTAAEQSSLKDRRTAYRVCLSTAQMNYSNRWDASCKTKSEAADRARLACSAGGTVLALCLQYNPAPPVANCELSGAIASNYDAELKASNQRCLDEAKIGLAGFGG